MVRNSLTLCLVKNPTADPEPNRSLAMDPPPHQGTRDLSEEM